MPKNRPTSLSDVIKLYAPEGANDRHWLLIEHQLVQCKTSAHLILESLKIIYELPENLNEKDVASDCLSMARSMHREILGHYASFLSYLAGTDVSEKMGRKEL